MVDNPSPALAANKAPALTPKAALPSPHRATPSIPVDAADGDGQPNFSRYLVDHSIRRGKRAKWNAADFEAEANNDAYTVVMAGMFLSGLLFGLGLAAMVLALS